MIITHKLEMDLARRGAMPKIDAVQGDANTRELELTLLSDGESWTIPEDAGVWMRYCKSDGTKGIYDTLPDGTMAWSAEENVLRITLAPQMLTAAGTVLAQAELVQGVSTLATFAVQITVERNPAADVLQSEDYLNMLQWMEGELDRLLLQAKESGAFDGPEGPQGPQGSSGPSVFEYAVEAGYTGTEDEFANMLLTPCLPLEGGIMTGAVDMGGQALGGLPEPEDIADAATKGYVDGRRAEGSAVFRAAGWSESAPYTQTVTVATVQAGDWLRMEPAYRLNLEMDLAMKEAFDCISYVTPMYRQIRAVCLEEKPVTDLTVYVESLR